MAINTMINSFNSGEMSSKLAGRVDVSRYYSGCQTLENAYVMISGGAARRSGTYKAAAAKFDDKKCRVKRFEFSVEQAYILEFGEEYIRFYKDNGQILSGASAYEIASPYQEDDLFELTFTQSADVLYIFHNDYKTRKLTRTGHTAWTLTEVSWVDGPFMDENAVDSHTLAVSATTGTNKDIVSTVNIFDDDHIGAIFKIIHEKTAPAVSGDLASAASSSSLRVDGDWIFKTGGTWTGTLVIERSLDGGATWNIIRSTKSNNDTNVSTGGEETEKDALYRVTMSSYTSGKATYNLECTNYFREGIVKITAVIDAKNAKCDILDDLEATTATDRWAEGAFSDYRGYPACGTFHEERLWLFATKYKPQSGWCSVIGEFDSFRQGINDDDAFMRTLSSDNVNGVLWVISHNQLLLGTKGAEWKLGAADPAKTITPTDAVARRQSKNGSVLGLAQLAGDAVLYAQRGAKTLREYAYNYENEGYVSPNMTIYAEHITGDGIVDMCFVNIPEGILYCVRGDGQIACFTYERKQEVIGWSRIITDGEFESVDWIPTETEDQVWVSVKRTIGGATKRFIEYFMPRDFGGNIEDAFFVDCGLSYDGSAAVDVSGVSVEPNYYKTTITAVGHGFVNGDTVRFRDVGGAVELNNNVYTVSDKTDDTFMIKDSSAAGYINGLDFGTYTSGGNVQKVAKIVSNLSHLEGKTVQLLADGAPCDEQVVSGGEVDCGVWANKIHCGLGFDTIISPMPLELVGNAGSTAGKIKRITAAVVMFYETVGCKLGSDNVNYEVMTFRSAEDNLGMAVSPWTGSKKVPVKCDSDRNISLYMKQDQPLPMSVLAVVPEMAV